MDAVIKEGDQISIQTHHSSGSANGVTAVQVWRHIIKVTWLITWFAEFTYKKKIYFIISNIKRLLFIGNILQLVRYMVN